MPQNTFHVATEIDGLLHPLLAGTGCVIDQSHGSSLDLMVATITLAEQIGYQVTIDLDTTIRQYSDGSWDAIESLDWEFDAVIDWLNEYVSGDGYCWHVDENSLFHDPIVWEI